MSRLFTEPAAAAAAASGNVYVADRAMIREYDGNGETAARWGGAASPRHRDRPRGQALRHRRQNHRILEFGADGALLARVGRAGSAAASSRIPRHRADAKGNIYVADSGNARVQKLEPGGQAGGRVGHERHGTGSVRLPQGICLDGKGGLRRRSEEPPGAAIRRQGKFLAQVGTRGTGPGQFELPTGIAADRDGNIYVADTGNHRIQKFRVK